MAPAAANDTWRIIKNSTDPFQLCRLTSNTENQMATIAVTSLNVISIAVSVFYSNYRGVGITIIYIQTK